MSIHRTLRTTGCAISPVVAVILAAVAAAPAGADVATWGGNEQGTKVEAEFEIYQNEHDWAQGVRFTNYNKDRDINGWYIIVTDFSDADSSQSAPRDIDAEAWGESVANGEQVVIDSEQWLDGEWNEQGLRDVEWTDESRGVWMKAMPDHYWSIGYPEPVDGMEGFFSHTFTLSNDDLEFPLLVTGLTFLPMMAPRPCGKLSDLIYDGEVIEDLALMPGETWEFEIITEGDYLGGYIFFAYGLFDCDGILQVCQAYGGHPVVLPAIEPCEGDTNGDGVVDTLDLLLMLSNWGMCP
jgi:hypothetical protein